MFLLIFAAIATAKKDGLAHTPPMGFSTWDYFQCNVDCTTKPDDCISEHVMREVADALVDTGLAALGYEYVNIDDCWSAKTRDPTTRRVVPDPQRFPSGMKALAAYVHSKGLKFGIYGDCGTTTCEGYPGTEDKYITTDAQTWADWDVDYFKWDGCAWDVSAMNKSYTEMSAALTATGRPIVFSCSWPAYVNIPVGGEFSDYTYLAKICHLWRSYSDITNKWDSGTRNPAGFTQILDWWATEPQNSRQLLAAGPGAWNDPDMLEVGNGMTHEEDRCHFSLWSIIAAPLIIGADPRKLNNTRALEIYSNTEVIAVDQDKLGQQGGRVQQLDGGMREIWARNLSDGSVAVVMFNKGTEATWVDDGQGAIPDSECPNTGTGDGSSLRACQASCLAHGSCNAINYSDNNKDCIFRKCDVLPPRFDPKSYPEYHVYHAEGQPTKMTVSWPDVISNIKGPALVRDLWGKSDLSTSSSDITLPVMPHACRMLKLTPVMESY